MYILLVQNTKNTQEETAFERSIIQILKIKKQGEIWGLYKDEN